MDGRVRRRLEVVRNNGDGADAENQLVGSEGDGENRSQCRRVERRYRKRQADAVLVSGRRIGTHKPRAGPGAIQVGPSVLVQRLAIEIEPSRLAEGNDGAMRP